ncbi:hypothetical protein, partial [Catellatospora chokoriensis]
MPGPKPVRSIAHRVLVMVLMSAVAVATTATPALAVSWSVTGHITAGGQPVVGVSVAAYPPGSTSGSVASAGSNSQGDYAMQVPDGVWDIVFTPPAPYQPVTRSNFSVTGNQTLDLVLIQEGVSTLSGRILDHTGTPAGDVTFRLIGGFPTGGTYATRTGTDGRFTLYASNGTYSIRIAGDSNTSTGDLPTGSWDLNTNATYQLTADTNTGDITLPKPVHLTVTVTDPTGQPVPDAQVRTSNNNPVISGLTTLLGLPVTSGKTSTPTNLTAANGSTPTVALWPTAGTQLDITPPTNRPDLLTITTTPVSVTADQTITATLPSGPTMTGRILDHTGTPAGDVTFRLIGGFPTGGTY